MQGVIFVTEVLAPESVVETRTNSEFVTGSTITEIVEIARQGPPGPQGPPGSISGFPLNVSSPQNGDTLIYDTAAWTNRPKSELTDGGNF